MAERDDNLGVFRDFINELDAQGAFHDFPKSPPISPDTSHLSDTGITPFPASYPEHHIPFEQTGYPERFSLDVPGAEFSLSVNKSVRDLPISLAYPSIGQDLTVSGLHESVSEAFYAVYKDTYFRGAIQVLGMSDERTFQFDLTNAWNMEDYKQFLERGNIDDLIFTLAVPVFIDGQERKSTTLSYRFTNPETTECTEEFSFSSGIGQNFPHDLAALLLTRHEGYNRLLTKNPDAHAQMLTEQMQEIIFKEFPSSSR